MFRPRQTEMDYLEHIFSRERPRLNVLVAIGAPMLLAFVAFQAGLGSSPPGRWLHDPVLYLALATLAGLAWGMRRVGSALAYAWLGVVTLGAYAVACALLMEPTPRMLVLSLPWFIVTPIVAAPFWTHRPFALLAQAGCTIGACIALWRGDGDGATWAAFASYTVVGTTAAVLVFNAMAHGRRNHYRAKLALEQLSRIDPLTQVMNRRHFFETGESLLEPMRPGMALSACFLDMDHFKRLNDEGSHRVGDMILVEAARCLKAHERDGMAIGRLGGEEFGILMPGRSLVAAIAQLEEIRARIATIEVEGFSTTASSGIAEWRAGESLSDLLHRADLALLQAKRNGRNQVASWTPALSARD